MLQRDGDRESVTVIANGSAVEDVEVAVVADKGTTAHAYEDPEPLLNLTGHVNDVLTNGKYRPKHLGSWVNANLKKSQNLKT